MPGRVEFDEGVGGGALWVVRDGTGRPVLELRADVMALTADEVADVAALAERLAARRALQLIG